RRHTRFSRDWSSDVCSSDLQFVEAFLTLPDVVPCTAVLVVLDLREVLPRLAGNLVQVGGAFDEFGFVEDQAPAQHATQVFAGLRSEERRGGKGCRSWW